MKKTVFATMLLTAALIAATCLIPSAGTAFATDENYRVISPALDNYLYLISPELTAVKGNTVAVYDGGANKVFVAGGSHAVYDTDFLEPDEKVFSLAFSATDVYLLTDRSRLFNLTTNSEVVLENDVTSMTSSGGYVYFYNSLRTVYRYDGATFEAFSDSARIIFGATSFVVSEDTAYFYKENKIYKLALEKGASAEKLAEISADTLLAAPTGVFAISQDGLTLISSDGEVFDTMLIDEAFPDANGVTDISSDGENIAVLTESDRAVYRYCSNGYTLAELYGCAGNGTGWYCSPEKILNTGNGTFTVWDKGNSRLDVYRTTDNAHTYFFHTGYVFSDYAGDSEYSFFTDGNNIFLFDATSYETGSADSIQTEFNIGAMCVADGRLYVYDKTTSTVYFSEYGNSELTDSALENGFTASNLKFNPLFVSYNNILSMCASGGEIPVVYANTGSKIEVFSSIGKSNIGIDLDGEIGCFDVDAVGNIFTFKKTADGIYFTKYLRSSTGYSAGTQTLLLGDFEIHNANGFALSDNDNVDCALAIDTAKNLLIKVDLDYVRENEYTVPEAVELNCYRGDVSFVKSKGAVIYYYPDNFNCVAEVSEVGDVLIVLDGFSTADTLFVMTDNGYCGYAAKTDTVAATPLASEGTVIALHDSVNVYALPTTDADYTTFDKTQVFTLVDDCADFGGGTAWYKVSYLAGGETLYGYLMKSRVMSYTVVPVIEETVYAKAKAARLGATVNIYAMADTNSTVVLTVKDGTKLKLLEEYNENSEFTHIEYDGAEGYVLTSQLQLTGILTGGQIAAIVLASVTVIITALYFILSRRTRRNPDRQ